MAGWQEPKSNPKDSTSPKSYAKYSPKVKQTFSSVEQARLFLMGLNATPLMEGHVALTKWLREFKSWSREDLENRHLKLSYDLHTLRLLLETPPAEWTPEFWLQMRKRQASWEGQREAAWAELYGRPLPFQCQDDPEESADPISPTGPPSVPARGRASTSSASTSGTRDDPFDTE